MRWDERAAALRRGVALAPFTTLGVGGPARFFARAVDADDVAAAHEWCRARGEPLFVLGGGSNLVVADRGFEGLVLQIAMRGLHLAATADDTLVTAAAGEAWDALVSALVSRNLAGVECLSGIPGTVGGTPIQNVGAYGQEVADTLEHVTAFDRSTMQVIRIARDECGFAYRFSRFKGSDAGRFVVCAVALRLRPGQPLVRYPDLRTFLESAGNARPTLGEVRDAVLTIRRRKGMVLEANDPDARSVGSFFMNPQITVDARDRIALEAGERPPAFAVSERLVKIPAAWLIERSGFAKAFRDGAVGISTRHPLAIVTSPGAAARDVIRLAVRIKREVARRYGVWLRPEPVFVGFGGDADVEYLQKGELTPDVDTSH